MKTKLLTIITLVSAFNFTQAGQVLDSYSCDKANGEKMTIEVIDNGRADTLTFIYDNVHGYLDLADDGVEYNDEVISKEYEKKEGPYKNHWFGFEEYAEYESSFFFDKNTLEGSYRSSQFIYPKSITLRLISNPKPYVREASFKCEKN